MMPKQHVIKTVTFNKRHKNHMRFDILMLKIYAVVLYNDSVQPRTCLATARWNLHPPNWIWRRSAPPKPSQPSTRLHGLRIQKTTINVNKLI